MMDLSREAVTIISELSMGVATAVTMSVWARMVPRRTRPSAIVGLFVRSLLARVGACLQKLKRREGRTKEVKEKW